MLIGVPKERKNHEYRVGLTPASVLTLVRQGHDVIVEKGAGEAIGLVDRDYERSGATIVETPKEIFDQADMIVKVKEPQPNECKMLREGQILFTFLHLAPDREQTKALIESKCVAIAYETVTDHKGGLPLLTPMSEVAGRLAVQVGAHYLQKMTGGEGVLLGGVPGVEPCNVTVIGGGVVGVNAIRMALGLEANVTVFDISLDRLRQLNKDFDGKLNTIYSTEHALKKAIAHSSLVIGGVLVPGDQAPKVVTEDMVQRMRPGSVLVDVAIDQGGCIEGTKPTTHDDPIFIKNGIIHYCVANMPGAVPRTSTFALNNATLPFILDIAEKGYQKAMQDNIHLRRGLNVCHGEVTCEAVSRAQGLDYTDPKAFIETHRQ